MKKSFTITEVIIALSILGIIATLTIPTLYKKYQRKVTITKVKSMYTLINSAYKQYLALNNNDVETYYSANSQGAEKIYNTFIKKYFDVTYNAGTVKSNKQKIVYNGYYKKLDGSNHSDYTEKSEFYAVQLKNGDTLLFRGTKGGNDPQCDFVIFYDSNGKAEPNIFGEDMFIFSALNGRIYPGVKEDIRDYAEKECITGNRGFGCSAWIISHDNMDYLDCPDSLTWEKGKCN